MAFSLDEGKLSGLESSEGRVVIVTSKHGRAHGLMVLPMPVLFSGPSRATMHVFENTLFRVEARLSDPGRGVEVSNGSIGLG